MSSAKITEQPKRKKEIERELGNILKINRANCLPEVLPFLDEHEKKLREELKTIQKRNV